MGNGEWGRAVSFSMSCLVWGVWGVWGEGEVGSCGPGLPAESTYFRRMKQPWGNGEWGITFFEYEYEKLSMSMKNRV